MKKYLYIFKSEIMTNLQYAFEIGATYENAKTIQNWYISEEIKENENLQWKNVTLIKLTAKAGKIENGSKSRISIKMKI